MVGAAQDVEAGRAYVTLYLKRTNYDRQVNDLGRQRGPTDRPSQAIASQTEAGASIPAEFGQFMLRGAAARAGSEILVKMVPALSQASTAAAGTATAVASVGTAAAATAPAVAAAGTAATGAATGFGAMAASLAPILIPLAAVAAAAATVYVAIFKWEKLPLIVRVLAMAFSPLILAIRLVVNAFKAVRLAASLVTAPFRLAAAAVRALRAAVLALPGAVAAAVGVLGRLTAAAAKMAVQVARSAAQAVRELAKIPGALVRHTSAAIRGVGGDLARLGAVAAGAAAAIVGPMTLAAKSWAAYGERIRDVQNQLLKFGLTAEEASLVARVSDQTGESIEKLAEQLRDGTRDFSRWRTEMQRSGTLMSGPGLSAALALSRAYYSLKESVVGLKNAVGEALGPSLTESARILTGLVQGAARWISQNKPLVAQIFKIATAVATAAGAVVTLGGAIAGAGTILTPFAAALAAVAGSLAIVEVRTGAGRSLWAAYGDSVRRVYATVVEYLGQMAEFAGRVFGGVKDALIAGDLAAAVDVMWAGAKVAWLAALKEIDALTSGVFGGVFSSLAAGKWSAAGESAMNALQQAWLAGVNIVAGIWDRVADAADTAWTSILIGFDGLVEKMKAGLADFLGWMRKNVVAPVVTWMSTYAPQAVSSKAFDAAAKLKDAEDAIRESLAGSGPDREAESEARKTARQTAADAARLDREREIEALKKRQAELAQAAGADAAQERSANQAALDDAIAAAKAARDAADAGRLSAADFAVSQETQSIVRTSGEALGLAVGRDDPARKAARLNEEQLKELKTIAKELGVTLREVLRLQAMGGFL